MRSPFIGGPIRALTVSLIGAAALAAGLLLLKQQKQIQVPDQSEIRPGETVPSDISLERLRKSGY